MTHDIDCTSSFGMSRPKKSEIDFILNPLQSHQSQTSSSRGSTSNRADSDHGVCQTRGGQSPQHSATGRAGVAEDRNASVAGPSGRYSSGSSAGSSPPREESSADKPFQCDECHRCFKERGNLNKHVLSVHEKKRTKVCHICGKSFAFRDGLMRHVSHVHQNERRHTCEICNRQFKQLSHLAKHQKTIHKSN